VRRKTSRALRRLFQKRLVWEYNDALIETALWFKPDMFLAFKGEFIKKSTLETLRSKGIYSYNYYPDPSPFQFDRTIPASIWDYDCVFYTKWQWIGQSFLRNFRQSMFVPHGYDSEIHRAWRLDATDLSLFAHDVSVIGSHNEHKERVLSDLIGLVPSLDLAIWGGGWKERCRTQRLKQHIQGHALTGTPYAKAICGAKINLAVMMGFPPGLEDQTTTRTYEIPACGGFMLHERSPELLTLFKENEEVVCFDSKEDLAAKIQYYLNHPKERNEIASAGYRRCVPAYSYDKRMEKILSWHFESHPRLPSIDIQQSTLGDGGSLAAG
jgi:glycosyltransferase involved in cell wall biosynthesis